jgi:DNA-binding beta-propeller fold protein YncE
MPLSRSNSGVLLLVLLLSFASTLVAQSTPKNDYFFYVLSESADKISLVRFGPKGASVERTVDTGSMTPDIDGPHGISISPDKKFYYVSLANGRPFGSVWKYDASNDRVLGRVQLGYFPATMDVSKDGQFLYVVNFNLHGDMVPSSVSVVATAPMMEIARIQTCTMPHGSRLDSQGKKQVSRDRYKHTEGRTAFSFDEGKGDGNGRRTPDDAVSREAFTASAQHWRSRHGSAEDR